MISPISSNCTTRISTIGEQAVSSGCGLRSLVGVVLHLLTLSLCLCRLLLTPHSLAFDYPLEEDLYASITHRIHASLVALDKQLVEIERSETQQEQQEATEQTAEGDTER